MKSIKSTISAFGAVFSLAWVKDMSLKTALMYAVIILVTLTCGVKTHGYVEFIQCIDKSIKVISDEDALEDIDERFSFQDQIKSVETVC